MNKAVAHQSLLFSKVLCFAATSSRSEAVPVFSDLNQQAHFAFMRTCMLFLELKRWEFTHP